MPALKSRNRAPSCSGCPLGTEEFDALNCIRAMGEDYGGNYEGIEKDPEARKWRKMHREAIKLLETEYVNEYQAFCDRMAELNAQFPNR